MNAPELAEIVVCALPPQGSWLHLLGLSAFVYAAWAVRGDAAARPR